MCVCVCVTGEAFPGVWHIAFKCLTGTHVRQSILLCICVFVYCYLRIRVPSKFVFVRMCVF